VASQDKKYSDEENHKLVSRYFRMLRFFFHWPDYGGYKKIIGNNREV